ncbi:hypothetical protein CRENPOLYSF2_1750017 [Crenothrix polyspora]|uniref:Uncharacterized protein n=1 Tax=Crenothrix polyspora TaxID=360316 RepID=A0A1R4H328_9GAMM|nr:hypothetical protein CRENPOLYSF2_1750017 [Crenothrix polyspora]
MLRLKNIHTFPCFLVCVFTSPFEKGGLRGIFLKISPNPSFSKRGTERLRFLCFPWIDKNALPYVFEG